MPATLGHWIASLIARSLCSYWTPIDEDLALDQLVAAASRLALPLSLSNFLLRNLSGSTAIILQYFKNTNLLQFSTMLSHALSCSIFPTFTLPVSTVSSTFHPWCFVSKILGHQTLVTLLYKTEGPKRQVKICIKGSGWRLSKPCSEILLPS